jgi:hypothetical protein
MIDCGPTTACGGRASRAADAEREAIRLEQQESLVIYKLIVYSHAFGGE